MEDNINNIEIVSEEETKKELCSTEVEKKKFDKYKAVKTVFKVGHYKAIVDGVAFNIITFIPQLSFLKPLCAVVNSGTLSKINDEWEVVVTDTMKLSDGTLSKEEYGKTLLEDAGKVFTGENAQKVVDAVTKFKDTSKENVDDEEEVMHLAA